MPWFEYGLSPACSCVGDLASGILRGEALKLWEEPRERCVNRVWWGQEGGTAHHTLPSG